MGFNSGFKGLITFVSYFATKFGPVKSNATQYYVTRVCAYIVSFVEKYIVICCYCPCALIVHNADRNKQLASICI